MHVGGAPRRFCGGCVGANPFADKNRVTDRARAVQYITLPVESTKPDGGEDVCLKRPTLLTEKCRVRNRKMSDGVTRELDFIAERFVCEFELPLVLQ